MTTSSVSHAVAADLYTTIVVNRQSCFYEHDVCFDGDAWILRTQSQSRDVAHNLAALSSHSIAGSSSKQMMLTFKL